MLLTKNTRHLTNQHQNSGSYLALTAFPAVKNKVLKAKLTNFYLVSNIWIIQKFCNTADAFILVFLTVFKYQLLRSCTRFDITKSYILRTQPVSVFCMDNNKKPLFYCTLLNGLLY
jgi:hypothetical protein